MHLPQFQTVDLVGVASELVQRRVLPLVSQRRIVAFVPIQTGPLFMLIHSMVWRYERILGQRGDSN